MEIVFQHPLFIVNVQVALLEIAVKLVKIPLLTFETFPFLFIYLFILKNRYR